MGANRLTAAKILRLHDTLCHQRAYAQTAAARETAATELAELASGIARLPAGERYKLAETALAHTTLNYRFSWDVACWLAANAPGQVHIDWAEIDDDTALGEVLRHLLFAGEDEYFDSGMASVRAWLKLARGDAPGTDFDWLMAQLQDSGASTGLREKYEAADLPLSWKLGNSRFTRALNTAECCGSPAGNMKFSGTAKNAICQPLKKIRHVSRTEGARLVDVAMASLATRHRETNHFNHANANDVHVADVGAGVCVVLFGLRPKWRFPLECTVGHLVLVNGVPVGYGGGSALFRQVNTGVNIFTEYRGHGAAFLWVQVMRVLHAVFDCNRFIANPYQFGAGNSEALKSGAFWFYYKLGFRPVDESARALARREMARRKKKPGYRSDIPTLRKLATGDMHLLLPGARQSDLFKEEWLETSSMLATQLLAGARSRQQALRRVVDSVVSDLRIRSVNQWSRDERSALQTLAPLIHLSRPSTWSTEARREVRTAVRNKGGPSEIPYARVLAKNEELLRGLRKACQRAH